MLNSKEEIKVFNSIAKYSHSTDEEFASHKALIKKNINLLNEESQLKLIQKNCEYLGFIRNCSFAFYKKALKINAYGICSIANPSEELQRYIIKKHSANLHLVRNPIFEIQLELIKEPRDYIYINKPSKEIQIELMNSNAFKDAIKEVNKLSKDFLNNGWYCADGDTWNTMRLINHIIKNKHSESSLLFTLYNSITHKKIIKRISKHKNFKNNASYILEQISQNQ